MVPSIQLLVNNDARLILCSISLASLPTIGVLTIYTGKPEVQLENQMVRAIPFGKLQKIWAVIWGDAIVLLFKVSLADVDIFHSDSHSRNFAFSCFMLMPEIFNWMVFVNGMHPSLSIFGWSDLLQILLFLGHRSLIKNKTQTAVINILNLHILIMSWRFVCTLHTFVIYE